MYFYTKTHINWPVPMTHPVLDHSIKSNPGIMLDQCYKIQRKGLIQNILCGVTIDAIQWAPSPFGRLSFLLNAATLHCFTPTHFLFAIVDFTAFDFLIPETSDVLHRSHRHGSKME